MKQYSLIPSTLVVSTIIFILFIGIYLLLPHSASAPESKSVKKQTVVVATNTAQLIDSGLDITRDTCNKGGGHWNSCASSCRGAEKNEVCIQVCKEQCECGSLAHWSCPVGYECTDLLPDAQDPAAIGICTKSQNQTQPQSQAKSQPQIASSGIFKSTDGLTIIDQSQRDLNEKGIPLFYNPFIFEGSTIVFENQFQWRVSDQKGNLIASGQGYADSPDVGLPGHFSIKGFFDALPQSSDGTLELFYYSPEDGSEKTLIKVPVQLAQMNKEGTHLRKFKIYFSNSKKDPNLLDCSKVYPVERQTLDDELDQIAPINIHALLRGPTANEKALGYISSLPEGVHEPKIINNGDTFILDFDDTLKQGVAGSCRVQAIRSQIEKTIQAAFPDSKVVISVNGNTAEALQP